MKDRAIDETGGPTVDRWDVLAALAFVAGMAMRLAFTFPLHAWGADMDALLSGMTAFQVLDGHWPAFLSGVRLGALESWLHAASFSLFGVSRAATAVVPLLASAGSLVVFFALCRSLLGRKPACLALAVLAIPSPAFLFWTYQPNSYQLMLLLVLLTLLFADRLARGSGGPATALAFGFSAGLGWWSSLQSVAGILPAVAWVVAFRRRLAAPRLVAALAAAGFLAGAGPWLVHNAAIRWESIFANTHVHAAANAKAVASNGAYFLRYSVPELLVAPDPEDGANPPNGVQRALRPWAIAAYAAAGAWLAFLASRWVLARRSGAPEPLPGWTLLLAAAVVMAALNVFSEAGSARGLTVRYVLPCFFAAAASLAILGARSGEGSPRRIAVAAVAVVVAFNAAGLYLPSSGFRARRQAQFAGESASLRFLEKNGVRAAWGHFFFVYPLNFLSRETIRAVPYQRDTDHYGYGRRLPASPVPWALVSRIDGELEAWAGRAGVPGRVTAFEAGYRVFLPEPNPYWREPPARTQARLLFAFDGARGIP